MSDERMSDTGTVWTASDPDPSLIAERTMSVEVRWRAAEKVFQRAAQSDRPIDHVPRLHRWIDECIAGDIEMPEVARRYRALLSQRAETRRTPATSSFVETDQQGLDLNLHLFYLETEINRSLAAEAHAD